VPQWFPTGPAAATQRFRSHFVKALVLLFRTTPERRIDGGRNVTDSVLHALLVCGECSDCKLGSTRQRGGVSMIAPLLEQLRTKAKFWLSDNVGRRALQLAGE
jgi:hypothetical protein